MYAPNRHDNCLHVPQHIATAAAAHCHTHAAPSLSPISDSHNRRMQGVVQSSWWHAKGTISHSYAPNTLLPLSTWHVVAGFNTHAEPSNNLVGLPNYNHLVRPIGGGVPARARSFRGGRWEVGGGKFGFRGRVPGRWVGTRRWSPGLSGRRGGRLGAALNWAEAGTEDRLPACRRPLACTAWGGRFPLSCG